MESWRRGGGSKLFQLLLGNMAILLKNFCCCCFITSVLYHFTCTYEGEPEMFLCVPTVGEVGGRSNLCHSTNIPTMMKMKIIFRLGHAIFSHTYDHSK